MKPWYAHPIRYIRNDYHRGKHSNIPLCCIVWYFVRLYSGWVTVISNNRMLYKIWRRCQGKLQYIRCPLCAYFGHEIDLHTCTKECQGIKGAVRCH